MWYPEDNKLYEQAKTVSLSNAYRLIAHAALHEARACAIATIERPNSHPDDVAYAKSVLESGKALAAAAKTYLKMDKLPVGPVMKEVKDIQDCYVGADTTFYEKETTFVYSSPEVTAQCKDIIENTAIDVSHGRLYRAKTLAGKGIAAGLTRRDVMTMLREAVGVWSDQAATIYHNVKNANKPG